MWKKKNSRDFGVYLREINDALQVRNCLLNSSRKGFLDHYDSDNIRNMYTDNRHRAAPIRASPEYRRILFLFYLFLPDERDTGKV